MSDSEKGSLIVVDFETAARNRDVEKLMEEVRKAPPLDIELDITKALVHFDSHGSGGGEPENDFATVLISKMSGEHFKSFAAVRINRSQWLQIKHHFDLHFSALDRYREEKK